LSIFGMLRRTKQIAVNLGQVHEILGQCALSLENRGFESDVSFVVSIVLGGNIGGAVGEVGYRGLLGIIGYVLQDLAAIGFRDRDHVCCLDMVPWKGSGLCDNPLVSLVMAKGVYRWSVGACQRATVQGVLVKLGSGQG